ncbi:MAG: RNA polymerase sigma factor RpoH [Gammaproteobacteria bacterium]
MNQLMKLEIASPLGSLEAYYQFVSKIPLISEEEEQALARRFYQDNDLDAARQLVLAHMRFVVHVAKGYAGYGLALGDLIQEGNIGLMKAVKRFNPELGVRLITFAVHWIKAEIHEFIIRNWRIVKIATTKAQRKLFFNLRKYKKRLGWFSREDIAYVADELGVAPETVVEMEQRLDAQDASLYHSHSEEDEDNHFAPIHYLEDKRSNPADLVEFSQTKGINQEYLSYALEALDERSLDIIKQRWLDDGKITLHDLAEKYGISAERVRQLETNALKKLKTVIEEAQAA